MRAFLRALYSTYATLVFAILVILTSLLILVLPGLGLRRRVGAAGMRLTCWLSGIRMRVLNRSALPSGPAVVVANHMSYLDGMVFTAALPPRFSFVVKSEIRQTPVVGAVLRRMGEAFVDRDHAIRGSIDTRHLLQLLQSGHSLGFFPEGSFWREPGLHPFRLGAFFIAARAGVPVIPAVIDGTREVLPAGRLMLHHGCIHVRLLAPLEAENESREAAKQLRDRTWAAIHEALGTKEASATVDKGDRSA